MIVIHPKDETTSFLSVIYNGKTNITLLDEKSSNREIMETIATAPKDEIVMMLGHGTEHGLLSPNGESQFGRFIISSKHVEFLREHVCIGIWCNANMFAEKYHLNGLFSGMVISEPEEAWNMGINIDNEDLAARNRAYGYDLEYCLRHYSLELVPEAMERVKDYGSELLDFNYKSLYVYGRTT